MQEMERQTGRCVRDIMLIGGMLLVANRLMGPTDIGWLNLNPSPWLLLSVLIGGRYGIGPGLVSGLLASLGIAFFQARTIGEPALIFARHHPYFFTSLALGGFLVGEINRLNRRRNRELIETNQHLSIRSEGLSAELELARETRQDLQRHIALLNAPIASLDEDLRKLVTVPPAQLMDGLLVLLHQQAQISSAGIYKQEGDRLRRLAVLHPTRPLAEVLMLEEVPMAVKAVEAQSIASLADPLQTTAAQPFLAAIPWHGVQGQLVLLIQDMPLQAYEWPHLARISLIVNWIAAISRYRSDLHQPYGPQKLLTLTEFVPLVGQALEAEQIHHLPSIIVRADFLLPQEAGSSKAAGQLMRVLPPTALCTRLLGHGSLMILLPFGGETEAQELSRALAVAGPQVRLSHYLVVGPLKLDDFWTHLMLS